MGNLRLLMASNGMWVPSGYGVQCGALLPRLAELPEFDGRKSIAQFAWYGLQGGVHEVNGFRIYPAGADAYGNDIIGAHTKDFGANLVVTLIDAWVLQDTQQESCDRRFGCHGCPSMQTLCLQRCLRPSRMRTCR